VVAVTPGASDDDHTLRLSRPNSKGVKEVPDVSEVTIIGGRPGSERRADPSVSQHGLDPLVVQQAIRSANVRAVAGGQVEGGSTTSLRAGRSLETASDLGRVVVGTHNARAILLADVATIIDGDARPASYVRFHSREGSSPAVTLAIAKRKGTNAIDVARRIEHKLELLKGTLVPADLEMSITRNYGETAPTSRTSCCGTCSWRSSRSRCSSGWRSASGKPRSCSWPSR
jgi:multidrug efflux pump subunit AcrB